jgi:hypothetical protein
LRSARCLETGTPGAGSGPGKRSGGRHRNRAPGRLHRPEDYDPASGAPYPFDQPSADLAWLGHPALTGLPPQEWDALIAALMTLHDQQRETSLDKRRGHRPRLTAPGTGRRPILTLADRLLATILHQRLALPQVTVAALLSVRPKRSTDASATSASS